MKILITGISGFAASHLARQLVSDGHEVHGTVRVRSNMSNIEDIKEQLQLHLIELTDPHSVEHVIKTVAPEQIYHLAAQSYVRSSWDTPLETYRINIEGTINILEACRRLDLNVPILITSTSEIYGDVGEDTNEESVPNPNTNYGVSKLAQEMVGRLYAKAYDMQIVISRSFNITGPNRADVFVDSNFAKQIVEMELGKREPILKHGNLETARDFTDVRDVTGAYISILNSKRWGEVFCIGSGKARTIQELLDTLIEESTQEDIRTEIDPARFRPIDTQSMSCDTKKIRESLNWHTTIPFEQSMRDLLDYWRQQLA